jgi:CspA family cold shock protein
MRRSHHRAALTEAIAEATARFQADVRRLARTVLRGEFGTLVATLEPMLSGAGPDVEHAEPVVVVMGRRRSAVAGPRKSAAAATTSKPTVAARTSKPGVAGPHAEPAAAARTSKPAAAGPRKPAAAARASKRAAAAARAELPIAEPSIAEPVPAVAGTPEDPTVASVELEPKPEVVAAAVPADPELTAEPHPESASVAELVPAVTDEEPWKERAQNRREESAQRRQQRQERARIRRDEATGKRIGSAATAGACAAPAAVPVCEEVSGPDGTRAVGRRIQHGTVKWFSDAKGYGFVKADDGADAFVHHSSISSEGFRTLSVGQAVSYDEVESPKGLLAVNVVPLVPGTESARR